MLVMTKAIPQPIRGMSDDEKQSKGDFETFQLDTWIISRSTKYQAETLVVRKESKNQFGGLSGYFLQFVPHNLRRMADSG